MRAFNKTRRARAERSARPHEIRYYNLMMFATPFIGVAFCRQVAEALARSGGKPFAAGGQRPTLWIAPTGRDDSSCYVYASDAALEAARAAGIDAPITGYALGTELPPSRCLYLGDDPAASRADRKAHSADLLALCLTGIRRLDANPVESRETTETISTQRSEVF
jgi:hypothetical protein